MLSMYFFKSDCRRKKCSLTQFIYLPDIHFDYNCHCERVQYSTVQYSTVQCSAVQYSTVQYSTDQDSTDQDGTDLQ